MNLVSDLGLTLGHVARGRRPDVLPGVFEVGFDESVFGCLYGGVMPDTDTFHLRCDGLELRLGFSDLGLKCSYLVKGILEDLPRYRTARKRLSEAGHIVAYQVEPGLFGDEFLPYLAALDE